MKHFLSAFVLGLVMTAGVATAENPQAAAGTLEVAVAESAPTLEEIFAIEDAKVLAATTYQCWVFCDDGSQTLANVTGLLKCGALARNFCGAQACEFVFNNNLFTC